MNAVHKKPLANFWLLNHYNLSIFLRLSAVEIDFNILDFTNFKFYAARGVESGWSRQDRICASVKSVC